MLINRFAHKIDMGRLIIVPIFSLFMVSSMIAVYKVAKASVPVNTIEVSTLIHNILVVCFYALVVFLYIIRSSAKSTTRSIAAKIVAVVSSFLPFTIPLLNKPLDNSDIMLFANLVTIFGMALSLYSLSALGRSFSIIPQARILVQTGPYKLIRHPLYLGEFITLFGIVLARFSISAMTLFSLFIAMQIYRALREESLLIGTFPEYASYSLKKARFIPGIF